MQVNTAKEARNKTSYPQLIHPIKIITPPRYLLARPHGAYSFIGARFPPNRSAHRLSPKSRHKK